MKSDSKYHLYSDTVLIFGKYKGKPLYDVVKTDPTYLQWLVNLDNTVVTKSLQSMLSKYRIKYNRAKLETQSVKIKESVVEVRNKQALKKEQERIQYQLDHEYSGVYLLECRFESITLLKIGLSNNVYSRLKDLKIGNPFIECVGFILLYDNLAKLESSLHRQFADLRHSGEWFIDSNCIRECFNNHPNFKSKSCS